MEEKVEKYGRNGEVRQLICTPWEGVRLWMNEVRAESFPANNIRYKGMWINYCIEGSCELTVENEGYLYLGAGQICVGPNGAINAFRYPTGKYLGIELFISETEGNDFIRQLLEEIGFAWTDSEKNRVGIPTEKLLGALRAASEGLMRKSGTPEDFRMLTLEILYLIGKGEISPISKSTFLSNHQRKLALQAAEVLQDDLAGNITLKDLAARYGVSVSSLKKYFEIAMGSNFTVYRQKLRCKKAAELLSTTKMSVGEIAVAVGYSHQGKFGDIFRRIYGCSPSAYRRMAHSEIQAKNGN